MENPVSTNPAAPTAATITRRMIGYVSFGAGGSILIGSLANMPLWTWPVPEPVNQCLPTSRTLLPRHLVAVVPTLPNDQANRLAEDNKS